jgi:hypothetical protein
MRPPTTRRAAAPTRMSGNEMTVTTNSMANLNNAPNRPITIFIFALLSNNHAYFFGGGSSLPNSGSMSSAGATALVVGLIGVVTTGLTGSALTGSILTDSAFACSLK